MNTDAGTDADTLEALAISSPIALFPDRPPLDPGWKRDDNLQDDLDDVLSHSTTLARHSFAVVDLTDDPVPQRTPGFNSQTPAYAGYDDTRQRGIASLAKLLALYGAYNLRRDADVQSTHLPALTLAALGSAIRQNYQRIQAAPATCPNVEHMFDPATISTTINFTRSPLAQARLDALYGHVAIDPNFTQLTVREQLKLMAGWSDNEAATNIIRALGFDYLWQLGVKSGLYRGTWPPLTRNDSEPGGPGGLFVGRDYGGRTWLGPPPPSRTRPSDAPPAPNQAGTARSVALLLTMLARDKLVADRAGNVGMREMLRKTRTNFTSALQMEDSPIGDGLAQAGWTASQLPWDEDFMLLPAPDPHADLAVSKIGTIPGVMCNGLLVRTTRPDSSGVTITAVLVAINNTDDSQTDLIAFGKAMAPKLAARHGVT